MVSKELGTFFDNIRKHILDESSDDTAVSLRETAFSSVRNDPGLQQLVPYFINFISEKVTHCLNDIFVLRQMMYLAEAVTNNKSIFADPYMTILVPAVLTCMMGRKFGPDGADNLKEQYALRDLAASLIGHLTNKYGMSNQEMRSRVIRSCLKYFLDPNRSIAEQYGAINGIRTGGGPEGVSQLVLPNLKIYETILVKVQHERGENDEQYRMLLGAIVKAVQCITGDDEIFMTNGMNGKAAAQGAMVEEYLGTVIGSRIAVLNNHRLNEAILATREREE